MNDGPTRTFVSEVQSSTTPTSAYIGVACALAGAITFSAKTIIVKLA